MALILRFPIALCRSSTTKLPKNGGASPVVVASIRSSRANHLRAGGDQSIIVAEPACDHKLNGRRSANYQPTIWNDDYVQSLDSKYVGEGYSKRAAKLKDDVKVMLHGVMDANPFDALHMIDDLQRLGVSYHFEDEIEKALESIYGKTNYDEWNQEDDLHATSLKFRIFRQHGHNVPQEVFNNFKDGSGNFKTCLCEDTKGLLYLYEASYLSIEGETMLDEARDFAIRNLKEKLEKKDMDQHLAILVRHSLELPLYWRMPRLESRWFIDFCVRISPEMNSTLLEFAKLNFNIVQATHQEDLRQMSR